MFQGNLEFIVQLKSAMKKALLTLLLIPLPALSGGLLGDAVNDLGKIANNKSLSQAVTYDVNQASLKIERAALVQALQEDALSKRIVELENTVRKQQEIIARYEKVVAELETKLGPGSK
jgi:hypothetical protein